MCQAKATFPLSVPRETLKFLTLKTLKLLKEEVETLKLLEEEVERGWIQMILRRAGCIGIEMEGMGSKNRCKCTWWPFIT